MPLLLELPVEIQFEILWWCSYISLKRFAATCKHVKHLVNDSGALWRSRTVDYERLRQAKRTHEAAVKSWKAQGRHASGWDTPVLVDEWPYDCWQERAPIELHSLLAYSDSDYFGRYFGMPYEKLCVTWHDEALEEAGDASGEEEEAGDASGEEESEDDREPSLVRLLIHQMPEAQENATKPPVSTLVLKQRGDRGVHTENMRVVSGSPSVVPPGKERDNGWSGADMPASFTIRNEDGRPVTVEQVYRNWCFGANKILGHDIWDAHLRGYREFELLDDGTLIFGNPRYK